MFSTNAIPALSKYTHTRTHTHTYKYTDYLNQMNFKVKAFWKHSSASWNVPGYQQLNHHERCPKIFLEQLFIFPFQWKISYPFLCWGIDLLQSSLDSLDSTCGIYGCKLRDIYPFPLDFLWDRKKNLKRCPCKPLFYRCLQTLFSQAGSSVQGKCW